MDAAAHSILLKDGAFAQAEDRERLSALISQASAETSGDTLLLHFHGGLVDLQSGRIQAASLHAAASAENAFPLFFLWQSGLHDVLNSKLPHIAREPLFNRLLFKLLQFGASRFLTERRTQGVMAAPVQLDDPVLIEQEIERADPFSQGRFASLQPRSEELTDDDLHALEDLLQSDGILNKEVAAVVNRYGLEDEEMAGGSQARFHTLMDPEVIEEARYEALNRSRAMSGVLSGFILKPFVAAAAKLTGRFYYSRDHGPYLTFVEEVLRAFYAANVGQAIWKTMKQSISTAFIATDGAGSAAADALANQWARGTRVRRLVVLAHSAGSFYACEFLKHAAVRLPPTVQFDVIFVAPACDFTTFASTIQMLKPRISRFRHFAMSDALERADHLLKGIPSAFPASLLYLVSGVLEVESDTPLVGMERFYSDEAAYRQEPYDVVAEYVQPRTAWSRRNVGDFMTLTGPCEMTSHGGFYNEPATMNSIRQLLRTLR